ncbi:hypothetical protein [Streptomyces sp. NPDC058755]|uniref:hypothetical protein n=1 Tax=Streptomyces sp. NPDC058755 TaxID=3346624 RepID=UPI0036A3C4E2
MNTQRLPFPVPDERAHLFVDSYGDMHDLVEDLVVPVDVPEAAATVLRNGPRAAATVVLLPRILHRGGHALPDRGGDRAARGIPDAGKKPLQQLIKQGAADGILTDLQAEYLDYGRQIRNGMAHGQTTHAVMPSAIAVPMVTTSFAIVSELCAAPA